MTTRNYDTTNGQPYPRVSEVRQSVDQDGNATGVYFEQMAICSPSSSGGRDVFYLDTPVTQHTISVPAAEMDVPFPLYDPATGALLPLQYCQALAQALAAGQATPRLLYLVQVSLIRRDQLRRDAEGA